MMTNRFSVVVVVVVFFISILFIFKPRVIAFIRQALQWNPQGSRGRGRPRETWRRCMEREMKDVGMTWAALSKKAQDRDVWRMFVCGLYPDRGERQ